MLSPDSFKIFRQRPFTVLYGPSNAGKTSTFLNLWGEKIVISCVPIEKLALDATILKKLRECLFINTQFHVSDDDIKISGSDIKILIDEIHFFEEKDFQVLSSILNHIEKQHHQISLFVSMLTGTNAGLPFRPHSDILAAAEKVITIPGRCFQCGEKTMLSTCLNGFAGVKQVNKSAYASSCFNHLTEIKRNVLV